MKESKLNFDSSAKNEKASMRLSICAIIISVLGIIVSAIIQCYFSYRTEKRDGTVAIVKAIENNGLRKYGSEITSDKFQVAENTFQIVLSTMRQNAVLEEESMERSKLLIELQQKHQDTLQKLDSEIKNHKESLQKLQCLETQMTSAKQQIEELEKSLTMLKNLPLESESPSGETRQ